MYTHWEPDMTDEIARKEKEHEAYERNRLTADAAFDLCKSLEDSTLTPAGVKIDDKDYPKYRVVYELALGPFDTRPGAVKAAVELLERLKAGGLVK